MEEDGGMTWKLGVSQQLWAPSVCGTEEEDRQGDTRQRVGTQVSLFVVDCPVPAVPRRGLFLTFWDCLASVTTVILTGTTC